MSQNGIGANNLTTLLLCFASGVIAVRFLPSLLPAAGFAVFAMLFAWMAFKAKKFAWVGCLGLGLVYAGWSSAVVLGLGISPELEKKEVELTGTVVGLARTVSNGIRFEFEVKTLAYQDVAYPSPGRVRLTSYRPQIAPSSGEQWRFVARLKRPHGMQNPGGGFNYETSLFQQRIRATGYIVSGELNPNSGGQSTDKQSPLSVTILRAEFAEFLHASIDNRIAAAVLSALTVGIRSDMGQAVWQLLQQTGTVHLVAISGLHMGLVFTLAAFGFGQLWRLRPAWCLRVPVVSASALFGLTIAVVYSVLAGFTLPTRRALCVICAIVFAAVAKRRFQPVELLATALAAVLLFDPLAPFSNSFWLSFSAATILMMAVLLQQRIHKPSIGIYCRLIGACRKWIRVQFWLFLGMAPILLLGFQKLSVVAPLANLFAIPVIGMLVTPLSLLALAFWSLNLEQFALVLIRLSVWLLEAIWAYLEWLAKRPWALYQQGIPPLWTVVIAVFGIFILSLGKVMPVRWQGFILCLPMLMNRPPTINHGEFDFTLLDVGQGLASVVRTQNHVLVYDTGASYPSGFDLGRIAVNPHLRFIGAHSIDKLVLSHGDNDHAGGAAAVANAFKIDAMIMNPSKAFTKKSSSVRCRAGDSWRWDGVDFFILWPLDGFSRSGNNSSCVMKITSEAGSLLLTGDIEQESERILSQRYGESLRSEIMLIPHHGSKTSSSRTLLEKVQPKLGLVSAGYRNRFGHPHPGVKQRFHNLGIPMVNTADEGAISVVFTQQRIVISGHRQESKAYWQKPGKSDFRVLEERINQRCNSGYGDTIDRQFSFNK
jgi:competence protein ComEC